MKVKGETTICSAEGASISCESLRQKYFYRTQLWRELDRAAKGETLEFSRGNSQAKGQSNESEGYLFFTLIALSFLLLFT